MLVQSTPVAIRSAPSRAEESGVKAPDTAQLPPVQRRNCKSHKRNKISRRCRLLFHVFPSLSTPSPQSPAPPASSGSCLAVSAAHLRACFVFCSPPHPLFQAGALGSNWVSDRLGRRWAFRVAAIGFIFGTVVQSGAGGYASLMLGRAFVGLGVGECRAPTSR